MANKLKAGDIVKLKGSNQKMTVKGIATPSLPETELINDNYECVWYNGTKQQKAVFHKDTLDWLTPYYDTLHFANYE